MAFVLVVDQEPELGEGLRAALRARGHEAALARDFLAAREVLSAFRAAVIILGIEDDDVPEALAFAREVHALRSIPVVACVPEPHAEIVRTSFAVTAVITRPCDPTTVVAQVASLVVD